MSQDRIVYPTGWTRSSLPLLESLDDGGFEEFITDLLNLNPVVLCERDGAAVERRVQSASRLLSGKPQYGGDIRADVSDGEAWCLQCKRVQRFGPSEVVKAIKDAEEGWPHVDQYVLVTTCGLSADAQLKLTSHPKWMWWDTSRLTTMVQRLRPAELGIQLVGRHFDEDWIGWLFPWGDQPLLDWKQFFARDLAPDRTFFHHNLPYVPWSDILVQLQDFVLRGAGKALVLSAPGGWGKSRLLLELARVLEQEPRGPCVRFLNLNRRGLSEEEADFLAREDLLGDLVLVVDDAHRMGAALEDVAEVTSRADSVRLVVATRPYAMEAVKSQLYRHGYAEHLEPPLILPARKQEDMVRLAQRVLTPEHQHRAPRLAGLADKCPLLVILGGALINAGNVPEAVTDQEAFRERVFKGFKEDFIRLQPDGDRSRLDLVIRFMSFVSPVPKGELLYAKAGKVLACAALQFAEDLETLLAAGLLIENREGLRLYPDLFADAVLLDACLEYRDQPSALHRSVLETLSIQDFPAAMRNLAQADWEARVKKGTRGSLFDSVWEAFLRWFDEAQWHPKAGTLTQQMRATRELRERGADRAELLAQWASFAVYLPERTLELVHRAIGSLGLNLVEGASAGADTQARALLSTVLPPLLKPIAMWHPDYASRALELLWSLDVEGPGTGWSAHSNAITAIAESAAFDLDRQDISATAVMDWLEPKLNQGEAVDRLRHQPWILTVLLKPFFARELEHNWIAGRTLHSLTRSLSVDRTRPLRRRALAIADRFVNSVDSALSNAVIPTLREGIAPYHPRFPREASPADHENWRPDRLKVINVIGRAAETHRDSPPLLIQLGQILRDRCAYDPDPLVKEACQQVLARFPETFELRVARFLTSFAQQEFTVETGPKFKEGLAEAERKWEAFGKRVANEVAEQYVSVQKVCAFMRRQLQELRETNATVFMPALAGLIAEISPEWCSRLLEAMVGAENPSLDASLQPVIREASMHAVEAYHGILSLLPAHGRPEQLSCLIRHLGWKHLHGGGLDKAERKALLETAKRNDAPVVSALATVASVHLDNDPELASEILRQLVPAGESEAGKVLGSVARLTGQHAGRVKPETVAQVLANLGAQCLSDVSGVDHALATLAKGFPRQVYEHVRTLIDSDDGTRRKHLFRFGYAGGLPLGLIEDADYLDREIGLQWQKLLREESADQEPRVSLTRSLLQSEAASAPERLRALIEGCQDGAQLELATRLAAPEGTKFVFGHPELVRLLLARSVDLGVGAEIRETLWLSACGGGRGWTDGELNPEYRYILAEAESLANRFRDDLVLAPFFRKLAESERNTQARHREMFARDDDDL